MIMLRVCPWKISFIFQLRIPWSKVPDESDMLVRRYPTPALHTHPAVGFSTTIMVAEGYKEAIVALNKLQTNASVLQSVRLQGNLTNKNLPATTKYLARAGITPSQLDKLSVIHVTGTKGKGSTCAFTERLLRERGYRTGLYTSPHLVSVTERIRLDGQPLQEEQFTRYFWQVYNALYSRREDKADMPAYFKFLTVLALKVFLEEAVDVAVLEVGIGGEYDCTNVVRNPVACGITCLDLDHTALLGNTLASIAWHKAGIIKPGAAVFTSRGQDGAAMLVLEERAEEKQCEVLVCPPLHEYGWGARPIHLGLAGEVQLVNASLALQLAYSWLDRRKAAETRSTPAPVKLPVEGHRIAAPFTLAQEDVVALREVEWPGRSQIIPVNHRFTYFLDGAHTSQSMEACVVWYRSMADLHAATLYRNKSMFRVLVFNSTGDRDVQKLLCRLHRCPFDLVLFTTNMAAKQASSSDQANFTVSETSQHVRCQKHLETWQFLRAHMLAGSGWSLTGVSGGTTHVNNINSGETYVNNINSGGITSVDIRSSRRNKDSKLNDSEPRSGKISTAELRQTKTCSDNIAKVLDSVSKHKSSLRNKSSSIVQPHISDTRPRFDDVPAKSASLDRTHMLQHTQGYLELEHEENNAVVIPYIQDAVEWLHGSSSQQYGSVATTQDYGSCLDVELQEALSQAEHVQVLVTGSLHLVGGVLAVLDPSLQHHAMQAPQQRMQGSSAPGTP